MSPFVPYRFPAIRPVVPPIEAWACFLDPAYAAKWFSNFGPVVRRFEKALTEKFCHSNEFITSTNNCTSAIAASLIALKVRGRVLIPAYTFPATASAVVMAGAQPCVADVDLQTWSLAAASLDRALSNKRCEAVVLVAPFGIREDLSSHFGICEKHGIPVVIDNASGLDRKEMPLPNERSFETYSLHATKAFPIGEGGAIRSFASQAELLRRALNFGLQGGVAQRGFWGINGKLPEVAAAIGLAVLLRFEEVTAHRRMIAGRYIDMLREFDQIRNPSAVDRAPWQFFPLLLPSAEIANQFIEKAACKSLQIRHGYDPSLEDWPRTEKIGPCPNARSLSERMVLLPVYSDATDEEISQISAITRDILRALLGN